jgi:hypothetical protein
MNWRQDFLHTLATDLLPRLDIGRLEDLNLAPRAHNHAWVELRRPMNRPTSAWWIALPVHCDSISGDMTTASVGRPIGSGTTRCTVLAATDMTRFVLAKPDRGRDIPFSWNYSRWIMAMQMISLLPSSRRWVLTVFLDHGICMPFEMG